MLLAGNGDTIQPLTGTDSDLGTILGTRWTMVNKKEIVLILTELRIGAQRGVSHVLR